MICLGTNRYSNAPCWLAHKHSDSICIFAPPRTGKSLLAENIYLQMQDEGRRILILDNFSGEHSHSLWMNMRSRHGINYLKNAVTLNMNDFGFRIGSFCIPEAWYSLGFTGENAKLMLQLATLPKWRVFHNDDPKDFYKLVKSLPVNIRESYQFSRDYARIDVSPQTAQAARGRMDALIHADVFVTPDIAAQVPSWFNLLKKNNVVVNFNVGLNDAAISKVRAYAGLILRALRTETKNLDKLKGLNPLVVVEEADILAPNLVNTNEPENLASIELRYFVSKMGKVGSYIIFLSQHENMVHVDIDRNSRTKILGRMSQGRYADLTKHLRLDTANNRRDFLILEEGRYATFEPFDCAGAFARYLEDNQRWQPPKGINTPKLTQWL